MTMANIDFLAGFNLVKEILEVKSRSQPYTDLVEGSLLTAHGSNLEWVKSLPGEELIRLKREMEKPLRRDGWEARLLCFEGLVYSGVELSGFGVNFFFLIDSFVALRNLIYVAAIVQKRERNYGQ